MKNWPKRRKKRKKDLKQLFKTVIIWFRFGFFRLPAFSFFQFVQFRSTIIVKNAVFLQFWSGYNFSPVWFRSSLFILHFGLEDEKYFQKTSNAFPSKQTLKRRISAFFWARKLNKMSLEMELAPLYFPSLNSQPTKCPSFSRTYVEIL